MSLYRRTIHKIVDRMQRFHEYIYGFMDDPYMKEKLFLICMKEIQSEEMELSRTFLTANSSSLIQNIIQKIKM